MTLLAEVPYIADSASLLNAVRDLPRPVFLDCGQPADCAGRFDIVAADPFATLITRGKNTTLSSLTDAHSSARDPLEILDEVLATHAAEGDSVHDRSPLEGTDIPFSGGAIGYFSYDLGRRYERYAGTAVDDIGLPELVVGIYDWAVVVDHKLHRSWLVGGGRDPRTQDNWDDLISRVSGTALAEDAVDFRVLTEVGSNLSEDAYGASFRAIKDHIRAGNSYQVNLTQRFSARVTGDSWQAYQALRNTNPAPFSAFLDFPEGQVLSSSPERFLRVVDGRVETKPIKGTRRRAEDPEADRALADELRTSSKDRAENVMIVDLLRNDLGKVCLAGSVRADHLFEIETFASVHHLVSTVTGILAPGQSSLDLLRACFPGGSITGAPKLASMQIIDEVEPHWRGIYCGAIGYIGFDGSMDTNVAIRTLLRRGDSIHAWAGGGIVADSEPDSEFQESLDKAAAMLSILKPGAMSS